MLMNCFVKFALLLIVLAVPTAYAAEDGESKDVRNIFSKSKSDYDAKGIRINSFVLKPGLNLEEKYEDNIFSSESNESEDFITTVKPSLEVKSDWSRHQISASAGGDLSFYHDFNNENYRDYNVQLNGRLDILRETYITAGLKYNKDHNDRSSSEDNDINASKPVIYKETIGNLNFYRGARRISLGFENEAKNIDYDNSFSSTGIFLNNDSRDRKEYQSGLKLSYEIIPGYNAFVEGVYNIRSYDQTSVLDRDSKGYEVNVGTSLDIGSKTKGEIFAGFLSQEYDSALLADIENLNFGASILWSPTYLTSVDFTVDRSIEETTIVGLAGYIKTGYTVDVEHELLRNVLIGANLGYTTNEYEATSPLIIERDEKLFNIGGSVKYLLNNKITLNTRYNYNERESNVAGQDYSGNSIIVGLDLKI